MENVKLLQVQPAQLPIEGLAGFVEVTGAGYFEKANVPHLHPFVLPAGYLHLPVVKRNGYNNRHIHAQRLQRLYLFVTENALLGVGRNGVHSCNVQYFLRKPLNTRNL